MKIKYNELEDILLLEISSERIDYAEENGPLIIHYSKKQKPVLIEILDANIVLSSIIKSVQQTKNKIIIK